MKTNPRKQYQVNLITLGCSKNTVDSEVLLAQLAANGIAAGHELSRRTPVVIVNTCGFIEKAKKESIDAILYYADKKRAGKLEKLFVTGCLSERYREELAAEMPEVDGFFGTMDMPDLLARFDADYKRELVGERRLTTPAHYAYLKISEGCNRKCSFCAIPLMRGKHVSRNLESLVEEAQWLARRGVRELALIAQDLTFYGIDLYGKRRLAELLDALADVEGIRWIRLHYAYPSGFPTEILPVMRERANICRYLDMPLQHASDDMLRTMRRGLTQQKTRDLLARIRDEVPGIAIRTTFLVGFPGETERDFEALLEFVEEQRFDRLGAFTYSHEENTHGFTMEDDVPEDVKQARADALMETQAPISFELNRAKIGQTLDVLVDRQEGDFFVGRTEFDSPEVDNEVVIERREGEDDLTIGAFYPVEITDALEYDLFGQVAAQVPAAR